MKKIFTLVTFLIFCYSFAQYGKKPYQYQAPQQIDIGFLGNVTRTLQNRHDANIEFINTNIDNIYSQINNLDITTEQRNRIKTRFKKILDYLNEQRIDYSSSSATDNVVDWLYENINKIIESEV